MRKINFLIIVLFFLVSCGGLKEAGKVLRNEKTRTTDEFLVKQKDPLVLPPNYSEIPKPGSLQKKGSSQEEKIRKILKVPDESPATRNKNSTIEKTILDKIRK